MQRQRLLVLSEKAHRVAEVPQRHAHPAVVRAVGCVALTAIAAIGVYGLVTGTPLAQLYQETVQQMGLFMDGMTQTSGLEPELQQEIYWMVGLWQRLFIGIWLATLTLLIIFYALLIRGWMLAAQVMEDDGLALLTAWSLPFPFVGAFVLLASTVLMTATLASGVSSSGRNSRPIIGSIPSKAK